MRTKLYVVDIVVGALGAGSLLLWRHLESGAPRWVVLGLLVSVVWFLGRWYAAVVPRSIRVTLSAGEPVSQRAFHFFLLLVAVIVLCCVVAIAWIFIPTWKATPT